MKECPVCSKEVAEERMTYCSKSCSGIGRRRSNATSSDYMPKRAIMPTWGAAYLLDGEFYKIGHLDKVYRWGVDEWRTSTRTINEIKSGLFGRFWGGRFKPEVKA